MLRVIFVSLVTIFLLIGCEEDSTSTNDTSTTALYLSTTDSSIGTDESSIVYLKISGLDQPIFGLSAQISFNSNCLTVSSSSDVISGNVFYDDALLFVNEIGSTIHISATQIQGESSIQYSGTVLGFIVDGLNAGTCDFEIDEEYVAFYDSLGSVINIDDLEFGDLTIQVN